MKRISTRVLIPLLILGIVFGPFSYQPVFAQDPLELPQGGTQGENPLLPPINDDDDGGGQTQQPTGGQTSQPTGGQTQQPTGGQTGRQQGTQTRTTTGQPSTTDLAGEALSCSVGTLIANILTSAIYAVLAEALADIAVPGLKVKVQDSSQEVKSFGLTIAGTTIPILPSLDAIAYCLVNAIITYIADSTIAWIRSGFQGNPVFVDDPAQFFQGLVDYEITNFISGLGGGAFCTGIDIELQLALLQEATRNAGGQARCTADQALQRIQSGNFVTADINTAYGNPNQLPINAYFAGASDLNSRIVANLGTSQVELSWNKGFLSFKDPENPTRTITPGQMIERQLSERIGFAEERLVLSDKFDQVITELVNALVKIAVNEMYELKEGTPTNNQRNYGAYVDYYESTRGESGRPLLGQ